MINFLERRSKKIIGQNMDGRFIGRYCKFGVIIVGKVVKVYTEGKKPYQNCMKEFINQELETLYLIGGSKNMEFVNDCVCEEFFLKELDLKFFNQKEYSAEICSEKECWRVENYLVVLRKNLIKHYHKYSKPSDGF